MRLGREGKVGMGKAGGRWKRKVEKEGWKSAGQEEGASFKHGVRNFFLFNRKEKSGRKKK